jgi:cytochrome c5
MTRQRPPMPFPPGPSGVASGLATLAATLSLLIALPMAARAETAIVLKSVNVTLPESTTQFPEGAGADTANANCLACHSVGMVMNQPTMPKAAWEAEVNKMRNVYKAPVDASSVAEITDYLTSIKGPKQ